MAYHKLMSVYLVWGRYKVITYCTSKQTLTVLRREARLSGLVPVVNLRPHPIISCSPSPYTVTDDNGMSYNACCIFFIGTEKFIDNLLNLMDHEPSFLLGSVSMIITLLQVFLPVIAFNYLDCSVCLSVSVCGLSSPFKH